MHDLLLPPSLPPLPLLQCLCALVVAQEGDRMAQSSSADKRRFLTPADNQEIEAVAAALPSIGSCEFGFSNSLRPGTC